MINIPNYQITQQIYESTNSKVFRALRDEDNQAVILKVLKEDYPTPAELIRYRQEYDITRRLADLEGIVKAYSLEKHQNTLVICLEDLGGKSLKMWLDEQHPFTLNELLTLARNATEILGQIHQQNIIHKDINPANLIFNPTTGVLKIIDFGISTQFSKQHLTLKNPDGLEGTLAYMSPEQTGRMNRALDYHTDFYSLGVTFYELFTGKLPFESKDAMELVHCHIAKQPTPPNQINSELPIALSNIIIKLLEKTAEARYQSAWGLKADLEKLQENLPGRKDLAGLDFELAQHDISDRFQIPQKLYGRESEIETLQSAFERVASGKAEIMLVAGYSGIGKSVLVKEIYRSLTQKQGYFISGKFEQFQRNIPYSAIVKAFKELAQQLLTESETQLAQWKEKLLTALGFNGQVIIDVLPEIELIIGKQPPALQLGPTESQNRFHLVFQNFMRVFCQPEHPLVIFLDDLQWVDSATLKLLELITTDKNDTALFLIGAYRDNEIDPTHPLIITLDKLREENVTINQITLKPLTFEHVNQLIAESLHQNVVGSLTNLVMRKTGGNPFFVNQFLHTLYEEDLLTFQTSEVSKTSEVLAFGWTWDINQIETLNITDNVVELMIGKLKKLPESAQQVLCLAACVGNHFDLDTLSVIYEKSASNTFQDLMPVLTEELILPQSELEMSSSDIHNSHFIIHHLQFLHDRIQQAAYALIDNEQKQTVHLQIGRLLLKNTPADALEEKVFDIVGHFNHSIELLNNQVERLEIAQLNLMAGQKAKVATAYDAAAKYFKQGLNYLTNDGWQSGYDLTLSLYIHKVEIAYLNGNFEQMNELAQIVLQHAKIELDKIKVYEIKIQACIAQGQLPEAVQIALTTLKLLGINFPKKTNALDLYWLRKRTQFAIGNRKVEDLINLKAMTDPVKQAIMRILMSVHPAIYIGAPELIFFEICTRIILSVKYGNTPESAHAYSDYGILLCRFRGEIELGYRFGKLGLNLLEQLNAKEIKAKTFVVFNIAIRFWKEHVRNTLNPLLETYHSGLETGDLEYAAIAIHTYCSHLYLLGNNLTDVAQQLAKYSAAIDQLNQKITWQWNELFRQAVLNLMGDNPVILKGEAYDEEKMLPLHQQNNDKTALCNLYFNKLVNSYLWQKYAPAVEHYEMTLKYLDSSVVMLIVPLCHFYGSLAKLAIYPNVSKSEQQQIWKQITANQKQMKHWAFHAPMNFQHKYDLVEAEKARVFGQNWEAAAFYEKAIAGAFDNEYLHEEALAYELASEFYLGRGMDKFAKTYMKEAHYRYQQWGALAKVKHLENKYSQFLFTKTARAMDTTISATKIVPTSTTGSSQWLDLNSVTKASQTLAGEIVLSRLLEKMMHLVIENAGAEKGFLLLPQKNNWFIEAKGHIDSNKVAVLQSIAIETSEQIPVKMIHYVARTQENVILHDATQEGNFTPFPYIVKHHPQSVLCTPLINQGKLTGILYLENNLTTGAFTPERLEVLNLLSSQIAISIENSLLYNNLEQKVAERTQELSDALAHLKTTQAQLVESEKMASLGGLVAGVAHEINTPIGIGLISASTLTKKTEVTLNAFKSNQLKKSTMAAYFDQVNHGSQLILKNLERASELVKSFKQVAVDQSNLEKRSFVVKKYLEEMLVALKPKFQNTPHQITLNGDEQIEISSYPGAFSQVVTNLLMNSITHAYQEGEKGQLCFDIRGESEQVIIEYSDDGCGIPAEHLPKIFDPFFTTERIKGGTGLGLHIVYNLVTQKLKGIINVESVVGVGTTFIINLPLTQ